MKHPVGTPCWVDLSSPDPASARAFYAAVLGWTHEIQPEEYGGYTMCAIADGTVAGIGKLPEGSEMPSAWTVYLAVADLAQTVSDWKGRGGQVVVEPMEVPQMGHMAILTDPAGAAVGLWQPLQHEGFAALGPHGAPCWFEVNTPESETVRDFFAGLFGHSHERLPNMHYYVMKDRVQPRFGVLQMNEQWEGMPPHWMPYFGVDDIAVACAAVEAHGGKIHKGPFDTAQGPTAVCEDPGGAAFMLIKHNG